MFSSLESLPLAAQNVVIDATMSYRKRGLAYFSGFNFAFRAAYKIENDCAKTIDLVFVFPIQMSKNVVLLSDLEFRVNQEPQPIDLAADADPEQILALDDAIRRVEDRDARMGEIVRLRFYAGLSIEQTAAALGVSPRTVKRDWTFIRAWLFKDLREAANEH